MITKTTGLQLFLMVAVVFQCWSWGHAQFTQRGSSRDSRLLSVDSDPVDVPCAGTVLFSEDFENGLGAWMVVDADGNTPRPELGLSGGWQVREDYKDSSNAVVASPSWYINGGQSNDWLISPQVTLGATPCLSWLAYSQDEGFLEGYEVLVSVSGTDTADFLALPLIDSVGAELDGYTRRAVSLSDYANQSVYIAFRQVSSDKFVLALDEVTITQVDPLDIGVKGFTEVNPEPGDTVGFQFEVANYGQDTVMELTLCWAVDGGASNCWTIDSIELNPNQSLFFQHPDSLATGELAAYYGICAWTTAPNLATDLNLLNDTLCDQLAVGSPVGVLDVWEERTQVEVFPNPSKGFFSVEIESFDGATSAVLEIRDLNGRLLFQDPIRVFSGVVVDVEVSLAPGMYLMGIKAADSWLYHEKILVD